MKIVHIIFSFEIGGSECMLVDIVNEQAKSNDVSIIIINNRFNEGLVSEINKNVKIYMLNRKEGSFSIWKIVRYNFIINKLNPDVIHSHHSNAINFIWLIKKVKKILTLHTTGISSKYFYKFDKIICISKAVQNELIDKKNHHTYLCENGINVNLIKVKNDFKDTKFKLIQVGSLIDGIKGQSIAIKALWDLVNKYNYSNVTLDFVGTGESYDSLKALSISMNLDKYIKFNGLKDRCWIYEHLKDYQIQLQPSIYEGFGLSVAEGMAAKIPVIVSDSEGPFEIIKKGKHGYFFSSGNSEDLSLRIKEVIDNYGFENMVSKLEEARNHILLNYTIQSTVEKYSSVYKD